MQPLKIILFRRTGKQRSSTFTKMITLVKWFLQVLGRSRERNDLVWWCQRNPFPPPFPSQAKKDHEFVSSWADPLVVALLTAAHGVLTGAYRHRHAHWRSCQLLSNAPRHAYITRCPARFYSVRIDWSCRVLGAANEAEWKVCEMGTKALHERGRYTAHYHTFVLHV